MYSFSLKPFRNPHIIERMAICDRPTALAAPKAGTAQAAISTEQATPVRLLSRDGMLCAALFLTCIIAAWPFAEIGINDDWSYLLTTQTFAHTHHLVFNGWAAPMLGWQALLGAAFAWLVRPDFIGIRLSMLPVAMATVVLFNAILRNFGLNRAHAVFGTLTFALSPLFLAVSATFMTDIPGLFGIFLCIYLCQRALLAQDDTHAALWLVAAGLTNLGAGTARQVAWLGVLVMVPCCAWLLRRRRYIAPLTVAVWILSAVAIKLMMVWFFRHPYTIPIKLIPGPIDAIAVGRLFRSLGQLVTTSLLFMLPVLIAGVAARWPPKKREMLIAGVILLVLDILYTIANRTGHPFMSDWLWAGNIVTPFGIMQGPELFHSSHRVSQRWSVGLFAILVLCAISFFTAIARSRTPSVRTTEPSRITWHAIRILLLPFLACYCVMVVPLALIGAFFDRYLLELIAVLLILTLRWHQERLSPSLPAIAIGAVVVIAILGVAATHDLFAMARAEVRLTSALRQTGVPRTEIRGGFDFDSVTQVYTMGYINNPALVNPPGSYHPPSPSLMGPCDEAPLIYLPALNVKYVVTSGPEPCAAPTSFPPQKYRTWLPPATRQLFIGKHLTTPAGSPALSARHPTTP